MQENSASSAEEPKQDECPADPDEPQPPLLPETEQIDELAELRTKIEEFQLVNKNLQNELTKKADVVNEMEKARTSMEKEMTQVSCPES